MKNLKTTTFEWLLITVLVALIVLGIAQYVYVSNECANNRGMVIVKGPDGFVCAEGLRP